MNEIIFEITQEEDGGYVAESLGENIFTQADTWEELRANVRDAVSAYYFDRFRCDTFPFNNVELST